MNNEYRFPNFDGLEPALQAAVKAALDEPIPEDAIDRVKARANLLAAMAGSCTQPRGSRHQSGTDASFSHGGQADTARPTFPTHRQPIGTG
jgi:hypothetical protein